MQDADLKKLRIVQYRLCEEMDVTGWFRDIETTFWTQPACFYAHTDEASTQPASVVSINH